MELTPDLLLQAYACGVFPMAESADDPTLFWVEPDERGILQLDRFHIPRRLRKTLRQDRFNVTVNTAFSAVMQRCAEPQRDRESTWINDTILELYQALSRRGHAHSVEVWEDGRLVGGLYGVSLGRAFFGESMFSRQRDTSKIALCHLAARLIRNGFLLLDSQFLTDHLSQFGAIEVPRAQYLALLQEALETEVDFDAGSAVLSGRDVCGLIDDAARAPSPLAS